MKPLHRDLQDIRVEKGVSLEDISRETKIRVPFLEKIEEGDFTMVPEPFIRAFLREYAQEVGLDPDRVIAKYEGKAVTVRDEDFWKYHPEGPSVPTPDKIVSAVGSERPKETPSEPTASEPAPVPEASAAPVPPPPPETGETPGAVKVSMRVIDDAAPDPAPAVRSRSVGEIMDEEERKTPKLLVMGIFAVVIIAATLAILAINGTIVLPF